MKKLLIIFILLAKICHAQNNRDKRNYLVYAAEVSLYDKNYNQSLKYFTKAFKYAPAQTSYELLTAASVAFKLNKVKIAESYLKESITKYKVPLELINTYPKLAPYKNSELIKEINSSYDKLLKEYYANLKNISAYLEVEQLVTKDQYVRSLTNYYLGVSDEEGGKMLFNYINAVNKKDSLGIQKYGRYVNFKDKNLEDLKFKLMENTDSLNIQRYIDITKNTDTLKMAGYYCGIIEEHIMKVTLYGIFSKLILIPKLKKEIWKEIFLLHLKTIIIYQKQGNRNMGLKHNTICIPSKILKM